MKTQVLWQKRVATRCSHPDLPTDGIDLGAAGWCFDCRRHCVFTYCDTGFGGYECYWANMWFPRRWIYKLLGRI